MAKTKKENYHLAKIKVVGVGGGGGNAISRMFSDFPRSVELIAINTDVQDLDSCSSRRKIHIGKNTTKGLGTGMNPDLGRQSAEESRSEISEELKGADMIFITAGEGGGTGTGAAPVIAEIAKELGILTVAIVTKPFAFEGAQRNRIAQEGITKLREYVDTLIVIPNDRIFSLIDKDTSLLKAFEAIDEVLKNAVHGITDLLMTPVIVNVDCADVRTIMEGAGSAIIGIGKASGADRSVAAAQMAINSPLLEIPIDGAKGVLFIISGHRDLKMNEVNEVAKIISENIDPSAKIIFGTFFDRRLAKGQIKVTLLATGFNGNLDKNTNILPSLFTPMAGKFLPETEKLSPFYASLREEKKHDEPKIDIKKKDKVQKKEEKDEKEGKKKLEEVWDIPAFLRKRKR